MKIRYPTIQDYQLNKLATALRNNETIEWETNTTWVGDGVEVDLKDFETLCETFEKELADYRRPLLDLSFGSQKHDLLEGRISGRVHQELSKLPIQVLDDENFWSYLALRYFWDYILWRHQDTFEENGDINVYFDGKKSAEAIPIRLYIRGQIALEGDYYDIASSESGTQLGDFWRSHITRVRTWVYPSLARAVVKSELADPFKATDGGLDRTLKLREFASSNNRRRATLNLIDYDDAEAAALVSELREKG